MGKIPESLLRPSLLKPYLESVMATSNFVTNHINVFRADNRTQKLTRKSFQTQI